VISASRPQTADRIGIGASSLPRIQGLDGLRAFSICLVLLAHLSGTRGFWLPPPVPSFLSHFTLGTLGVRVFFVISGFLITSLLMAEQRRTGTIHLRRFYYRRTLRIFPPYYLYLLIVAGLWVAQLVPLKPGDLWHAITYTMNYHRDRSWYVGHAWSLAVEEQFYLLWPLLFRWLGESRARHSLLGYILIAPIWRLAIAFILPGHTLGIGETFFTTADAIACGCALALGRQYLLDRPRYRKLMNSRAYLLVIPLVLVVNALGRFAKFDWLIGITVQNVLIALFVERVTRSSQGWVPVVLNSRPAVLIGLWSYSIYLWQQPILNHHDQVSWFTAFPVNLPLCLAVAASSYYLVERPALRLRQRFEQRLFPKRRSSGSFQVAGKKPGDVSVREDATGEHR
jgi:peptidoglycan/LPS O-acetylase OafA/YrhL